MLASPHTVWLDDAVVRVLLVLRHCRKSAVAMLPGYDNGMATSCMSGKLGKGFFFSSFCRYGIEIRGRCICGRYVSFPCVCTVHLVLFCWRISTSWDCCLETRLRAATGVKTLARDSFLFASGQVGCQTNHTAFVCSGIIHAAASHWLRFASFFWPPDTGSR